MPRGYNNFSYVIDSSFRPFEMQELLTPMLMYKDAYEKTEEAYSALSEKANDFEYLSRTLPEDSQARKIYEGYANDLKAQADDLTRNGLNMGNRRALLDMKRRYSGEIGRLVKARDAMNREQELRRQMNAKDPSMLWAEENFNIDRYLDNNTPNLYGISGTDLYTRGATAGKAASSRIYSAGDGGSTLGGYYRDYVQRMGYTPEQLRRFGNEIMDDFTRQVSVLPELQQAANQILEANGVTENFKDNPNNLRKAQQQVIRGIIDGAVYNESHNPHRDPGVLDASQTISLQTNGWQRDVNGDWNYDIRRDPKHTTDLWMYDVDPLTGQVKGPSQTYIDSVNSGAVPGKTGKTGGGSGSNSKKKPVNISTAPIMLTWRGNNWNTREAQRYEKGMNIEMPFNELSDEAKRKIKTVLGNEALVPYFKYYIIPKVGADSFDQIYMEPYVLGAGDIPVSDGEPVDSTGDEYTEEGSDENEVLD